MKRTKTSSFGTRGRVSHDSSAYYNRRMAIVPTNDEIMEHCEADGLLREVDRIYPHTCERMSELPNGSVHLMVTSPPYNVGKEYDSDMSMEEYREFLRRVWMECYRVLAPGGRACVNVANLGRKPYLPLNSMIGEDLRAVGFLMRGEIIWNKGTSAGPSTAWGSWMSAKNPTLRDQHEYILVFSKDSYSREGGESDITRDEFLEYTKSVWTFNTESARRVGHPAPFPVELPSRCIKLYTFKGDVVLDPFMGVGSTAVAARETGRYYIGYETCAEYVDKAETRLGNVG